MLIDIDLKSGENGVKTQLELNDNPTNEEIDQFLSSLFPSIKMLTMKVIK